MATIPQRSNNTGGAARRAEMMRKAWGHVEKHGSTYLGPVWDYLTAHPTLAQGVYYVVTGLWPLVHTNSFQAVTGPKTDLWLVQTVGVLIAVIGCVLLSAAHSGRVTAEVALLAVGCALALTGIDVVFVTRNVISQVYLLDAAAALVLVAAWGLCYLLAERPSAGDRRIARNS